MRGRGGVVDDPAAVTPDQTGDRAGVIKVVQIVRQQLFALADPHAVEVRAVLEDAVRIHGGKGAAHDDGKVRRRRT